MIYFFRKFLLRWRMVLWGWRLYRFLRGNKEYLLVPHREFRKKYAKKTIVAKEKEDIKLFSPKIVDENGETGVVEELNLVFPEISILNMENMVVSGRTPFFFRDGMAAFPDMVDIDHDFFKVEIFKVGSVDVRNRVMTYDFDKSGSQRYIESAISFLGECTGNYAHWLIETLPKLLLLDQYAEFRNMPVLVDNWMHPNFAESIRLFGKYDREIILVTPWEKVFVKNLVCVSPPAYIAPDHRDWAAVSEKRHYLFPFSKYAFSLLHDASMKVEVPSRIQAMKREKSLKKIYIQRVLKDTGNASRQIINNDELDKFMRERRFDFISPADFTLQEQIAIFREAEVVVSPAGAALSNLFFTKRGCKVVSISPQYRNKEYENNRYFFNNFMTILGHELYFILGEQEEEGDFIHRRYYANLHALEKILNRF